MKRAMHSQTPRSILHHIQKKEKKKKYNFLLMTLETLASLVPFCVDSKKEKRKKVCNFFSQQKEKPAAIGTPYME